MVLLFLSWLLVRQLPYIYNQLRLWLVLICMGDSDFGGKSRRNGCDEGYPAQRISIQCKILDRQALCQSL